MLDRSHAKSNERSTGVVPAGLPVVSVQDSLKGVKVKLYDETNDRIYFGRVVAMVLGIIVLGYAIAAIGWGVGVGTSGIFGRGEAAKQKNDATNRIQAQAQFHTNFESIRSLDQRLSDAKKALDDWNKQHQSVGNGSAYDPQAEQQANLERNVTGLQQQCRIAVADYDASTETYTLRDFRDADLPYKIRESDPVFTSGNEDFANFDCKT